MTTKSRAESLDGIRTEVSAAGGATCGEPRPETAEVTFQLYEDRLFLTAFEPEDYLPSVGLQLKKIR